MSVLDQLCSKFVLYQGGDVMLVKRNDVLVVEYKENSYAYDLNESASLAYWFNVVYLLGLNDPMYTEMLQEAIFDSVTKTEINFVCAVLPPRQTIRIDISDKRISLQQ